MRQPAPAPTAAVQSRPRLFTIPSELQRVGAGAAGMWLATRVSLALLTYVTVILNSVQARTGVPAAPNAWAPGVHHPSEMIQDWTRWDSGWYLTIAKYGYNTFQSTAFFPLYPLLTRGVAAIVTHSPVPAVLQMDLVGLIVSSLATLVAFVAIALLAVHETGSRTTAWRTLVVTAAYPMAFFLAAPYTESTFLAAAALTLLFIRRGQWLAAAGAAYLAGLTRASAIILVLPMLWEYGHQHGWWSLEAWRGPAALRARLGEAGLGFLVAGAVPLAILSYMAYLWHRYGTPLAFVQAERMWSRSLLPPWRTAQVVVDHLASQPSWGYYQLIVLLDLVALLLVAAVTVVAVRRLPFALTAYMCGLLVFCIATPAIQSPEVVTSSARYLAVAVPVFLVVARFLERRPAMELLVVSGGFMLQAALVTFYLSGGWLA